ncbi:MAG: diguanylate cyclase [Syntrophotaleaceae bacterium]
MEPVGYSDNDDFRSRIQDLEAENRRLSEICENLQATQDALEHVIGTANHKLLAAEMLSMELEQVFYSCADPTWVVRQDGIVVRANEAMLQFLGLARAEVVGSKCRELLKADICKEGICPLPVARRYKKSFKELDLERRSPEGKPLHYLVSASTLVTLDGSPGLVVQFKDITLRKEAEAALDRLARVDGLTQVANRRSFDEALDREWARLAREKSPLSLVLCDIDCFKKYNDHYGHQEGDECLRLVARALRTCANRPADLVARYGGEEFVFLLPNTPLEGALRIGEKAREAVQALGLKHEASDVESVVTLSLGAASLVPHPAGSAKDLVEAADEALYRAKNAGRNRIVAA